jgi:hypothetical protein
MTAPTRRMDAAVESWREAASIRQEWLEHGLSVKPADRAAAEHSLAAIYSGASRPAPRFVWVDSPRAAMPLVAGLPGLDDLYRWIRDPLMSGAPPLASDLAALVSALRSGLEAGVSHPPPEGPGWTKQRGSKQHGTRQRRSRQAWPELPPVEALRSGVPLAVVLRQGVRDALHRSLARGLAHRVRDALGQETGAPVPVCWYGQQDAAWVAHFDVLARLELARYGVDAERQLDHWATLVRSCGWWWPGEELCVIVERPESVHMQRSPDSVHDEVMLGPGGVRYRDGWQPAVG